MSWSRASRIAAVRDRRRLGGRIGRVLRLKLQATFVAGAVAAGISLHGQTPAPVVRVSFAEAIQRAQERNPTVAAAAASILRAEGLIKQARAATLLQLNGNVVSTTLNRGVE